MMLHQKFGERNLQCKHLYCARPLRPGMHGYTVPEVRSKLTEVHVPLQLLVTTLLAPSSPTPHIKVWGCMHGATSNLGASLDSLAQTASLHLSTKAIGAEACLHESGGAGR